MADLGDEVQEINGAEEGNAGNGNGANVNGAHARLQWTHAMSGFVLRRFTELVSEGVKTDKGFKDVHLNKVATDLSEFLGMDISGTQVYNHLRKWRAKWVKICRLKELSGSLWDEDNCMIGLAPDHYSGHVKVIESYEFLLVICFFNYELMHVLPVHRTIPKMQNS